MIGRPERRLKETVVGTLSFHLPFQRIMLHFHGGRSGQIPEWTRRLSSDGSARDKKPALLTDTRVLSFCATA
jgi:hypothetical protein